MLRASDPCRLLVLSRHAADATGHAQYAARRREGHAAGVCCSGERCLGALWVARFLHAIFTGGRGGSQRAPVTGAPPCFGVFFRISCVVVHLEIVWRRLAACAAQAVCGDLNVGPRRVQGHCQNTPPSHQPMALSNKSPFHVTGG